MQFLTLDDVFLTVAATGIFFLVEIGIFILAGMIWSTVGEKLAQLFCQPPKLRRMTDPVTAHALADLSGVTTRTITDLAKHSIAVREGRGNANGLRNCVK
jgi:hypothetical protein